MVLAHILKSQEIENVHTPMSARLPILSPLFTPHTYFLRTRENDRFKVINLSDRGAWS